MVVVEAILTSYRALVAFLHRNFPSISSLIYGPAELCLFPRTIFLYFYGIFLGYMLWRYFLLQLPFVTGHATPLTIAVMTTFGAFAATSRTFRCITSLSLVNLCGKSGRSVLRAIVVAFLIAGPMTNLLTNAREVVKVFTCSAVLTYNMTRTRIDLMSRPFMNAMEELEEDLPKIATDFERIDEIIAPIVEEIEGNETKISRRDAESDAYAKKYAEKLEKRCQEQIQVAVDGCKKSFADAYLRCEAAMPVVINYLLCLPMKMDFFCHFTRLVGNICAPEVDKQLGTQYQKLKKMQNSLKGNVSGVSLNYTTLQNDEMKPFLAIKKAGQEVLTEFDEKLEIIQKVLAFIEKLLAYVFIRVIFDAYLYHRRFLTRISFDNFYITKYFKDLDARRDLRNQRTLLPLRKYESRYVIDPTKGTKSRHEYKNLIGSALTTTMHVAVASCFVILDFLLTEILKIVRENAKVAYIQTGEHEVNVTVTGEGVIAEMVRKTLSKFNTDETIVTFLTNDKCLPVANVLPMSFYIEIYGAYIVIVLLILNEIYVHRLRWLICASAYPRRQKYRILFLYNKILKDRRNFISVMKHKLRSIHYENEPKRTFFFKSSKKKCDICHEKPEKIFVCRCNVGFCAFCLRDAGNQCLKCEIFIQN
ncbi:protein sneaky [Culicoides brevitarsis]|uniref:protein sneaky n=1 Tax=Culicoides brevitarsis TaxID=469753 RepID=UPI00307BB4CE